MAEITKDTIYYLETLVIDRNGDPVTGLTVTYKIIKSSDNSLVTSGTLNDVGFGVYQNSYTFTQLGQYRVLYTTPSKYSDEIETVLVVSASATSDELIRILGLCQENYRLYHPRYDRRGNMLEATIKIYATKADCDNDVNPIATYNVDAEHDFKGLLKNYKCTRIA